MQQKCNSVSDELKTEKVHSARLETLQKSAERVHKFIMNSVRAAVLLGCTVHFFWTQFDSTAITYNAEQKGVEFHMYGFNPNITTIPIYLGLLSTIMVPYDALYKELDVKQVLDIVSKVKPKAKKKP